jgi:hypothetical protein
MDHLKSVSLFLVQLVQGSSAAYHCVAVAEMSVYERSSMADRANDEKITR